MENIMLDEKKKNIKLVGKCHKSRAIRATLVLEFMEQHAVPSVDSWMNY
jgi:hypothetical protein